MRKRCHEQTKACLQCGTMFHRKPDLSDAQWESYKFCTRKCSAAARSHPRPIKRCLQCKKPIQHNKIADADLQSQPVQKLKRIRTPEVTHEYVATVQTPGGPRKFGFCVELNHDDGTIVVYEAFTITMVKIPTGKTLPVAE